MVKVVIPGAPRGKERPRHTRTGVVFTPKSTRDYEKLIAIMGKLAMAGTPIMSGPVRLTVVAAFPIPASYSAKRRAACLMGSERPAKKPDTDNILKALCDGLNGITWKDDAQVVEVSASKTYAEQPSVTAYIEELS